MPESKEVVVGIDIGGTNIKGGFVDRQGAVYDRFVLRTEAYEQPGRFVRELVVRLREEKRFSVLGVGVGAPNGNVFRGTTEYPPNLPWKGVTRLAKLISEGTGLPCLITNDANAGALGEMRFGAARNLRDFVFITLGTGLGSGIVVRGEVVYGHDGAAGELGHVIVEPDGRPCACGRCGCLEQYASATGLVATYTEIVGGAQSVTAEDVFGMAAAGEATALEAFDRTARILGLALANCTAYLQPEVFFLYGGLTAAGELLVEPVRRYFHANLMRVFSGKTRIELSSLPPNDAAVLGAASLIWTEAERA